MKILLFALTLAPLAFARPAYVTHLQLGYRGARGTLDVEEQEYNVQFIRIGCPQWGDMLAHTHKLVADRRDGVAGSTWYCLFAYEQPGSSDTLKIEGLASYGKRDWQFSYAGSESEVPDLLMEIVEKISRFPENTGPNRKRNN